ncbi:MAG: hypothetical protein R2865_08140 [Deinococcales bacterium]
MKIVKPAMKMKKISPEKVQAMTKERESYKPSNSRWEIYEGILDA